jgi:hypothetical protein
MERRRGEVPRYEHQRTHWVNRIPNPALLFPLRKRLNNFQAGKILKRLQRLLKSVMPCLYIVEGATSPACYGTESSA